MSLHRHKKQITLQSQGTIVYFPYLRKRRKLNKKSEVEVIEMKKKHDLCSNWQIVFISDTDKQTLIDLYEILINLNLNKVHKIF